MTINQQIKIRVVFLGHNKIENGTAHQITQHIRYGYALPFGTLPTATSYMLRTLYEIATK
jgi:hypothetical protein